MFHTSMSRPRALLALLLAAMSPVTTLVFFSGPLVIFSPAAASRYCASAPGTVVEMLVDEVFAGATASRSYM